MNKTYTLKKDQQTYKILKLKAITAFGENNYEKALDYIYLAATLAWNSHLGVWCDDELEHLLSEIGRCIIDNRKEPVPKKKKEKRCVNRIAYIVSHLYDAGGHSRILKEWVSLFSKIIDKQYVYITNVTNAPTISPYITASLKNEKVIVRQLCWYDSYINRIKKLTQWLETDLPDAIILFIHPNDIVAISSLLSHPNRPYTIFFNHVDHAFWLGRNAVDLVVEWRTEGAKFSKKFRKIDNIAVIPLTTNINPQKTSKTKFKIPETATVSISVGSFYKTLGDTEINYFETIEELLEMFPDHYHLFVTIPPSRNILEKYLPKNQNIRKRFIVRGPINNLRPIYGIADFLIETFPMIGGTVRIEAMACKVPIVAFRNKKVTLFSETDALPPNYPFIASNKKDIIKYSSEFIQNPELRNRVGNWLHKYYKQNFSPEKIRTLLIDIVTRRNKKYISSFNTLNTSFNKEQLNYDLNHLRSVLSIKSKFLMNKSLFLQSTLKRSKFPFNQRIIFFINSLKNKEFKSKKEIIGGIVLPIFRWYGVSLYFLIQNKKKEKT